MPLSLQRDFWLNFGRVFENPCWVFSLQSNGLKFVVVGSNPNLKKKISETETRKKKREKEIQIMKEEKENAPLQRKKVVKKKKERRNLTKAPLL